MRFWRKCLFFYIGGTAYMTLEFLWRGRSHSSMFLLGGACFLMLGQIGTFARTLPLSFQSVCGATGITFLELLTGLVVNRDYAIWDYRNLPLQYRGQICLPFSLLWIPAAFGGIQLYNCINRKLSHTNF